MATLRELGYDLLQHLRASNSDDDSIDIRSVYFWIKNQRALWIKNELAKHIPTSPKFVQDLGSLSVGGSPKKTSSVIPTPINYRGMPKIIRVGPVDTTKDDYLLLPYTSAKYHGNGRFNTSLIAAYYYNGYVYLNGSTAVLNTVNTINVRAVFEDPMDVTGMTVDSEYPLDDALIDYLKGEIIKLDLSAFIETKEDPLNDEENNLN